MDTARPRTTPDHRRPVADAPAGPVRGIRGAGVTAFRGIPYARPATGELRFRHAVPAEAFREPYDASASGPFAVQPRPRGRSGGSEDAAWLSVVVPDADVVDRGIAHPDAVAAAERAWGAAGSGSRAASGALPEGGPGRGLPVVVFFHGGSFISGSAAEPLYDGEEFARAVGAVVVMVNFRLGLLGQLDLSSLGGADPNPGLSDQVAAVEWVHANIAAFGGDPDRITLMGQSAGGAAIAHMLAVPRVRRIAAGAIAQSPAVCSTHFPDEAAGWAREVPAIAGVDRRHALRELRRMSPEALVAAGRELVARKDRDSTHAGCFAPVVDGDLLPRHPLDPAAAGEPGPPLLIGTTADEFSMAALVQRGPSARESSARRFVERIDPEADAGALLGAYRGARPRVDYARMLSDSLFWAPSVRLAERHAGPTWMYRLDYAPPALRRTGLGACHSLDLPLLLREDRGLGWYALRFGGRETFREVAREMRRAWSAFIAGAGPGWDAYEPGARVTRVWRDDGPRDLSDPRADFRDAWALVRLGEVSGGETWPE
ncbi:carboxylesterase/lipase family protein [Corynebacterium sp.]|uniref:carboxylesterase/lipase family protein n=1 Tax=Corynebacterium sp. TaxID=1720 RepID=UPI0026DAA5BF|nr:carboxylesterase family protein [Corynebacterium sp.]MDO4610149.1 carboxylesterase family protein [Corynebacterium sp.]